jgi:hypothetical protein
MNISIDGEPGRNVMSNLVVFDFDGIHTALGRAISCASGLAFEYKT